MQETVTPSDVDVARLKADLDDYGYVIIRELLPRDQGLTLWQKLFDLGGWDNAEIFNRIDPADYPLFLPLITNPVLLALADHVLGPGFKMTGDPGRVAGLPGAPGQHLHADVPIGSWFARHGRPFPRSCAVLNCIWALSDFTKDNGATELIPCTHDADHVPRRDVEYRHMISAEMPAGSVIAFHGALWHRRGANHTTDDYRIGVSVPYIAQWLDPVSMGWILLKRSVRDRLPEAVQRMNPHVSDA